jgi:histidine triad (HIT) family protein
MSECLFCKIVQGEIGSQKIYEDDKTFAFLDIGPVSKGHTLVIPKEHAQDLNSGSEQSAIAVMKTIYKLAPKITKALGASAYNLGMNHGKDAKQEVFHTHLHLIPRYSDVPRTYDKTFPPQDELEAVAEQIRKKL